MQAGDHEHAVAPARAGEMGAGSICKILIFCCTRTHGGNGLDTPRAIEGCRLHPHARGKWALVAVGAIINEVAPARAGEMGWGEK